MLHEFSRIRWEIPMRDTEGPQWNGELSMVSPEFVWEIRDLVQFEEDFDIIVALKGLVKELNKRRASGVIYFS